jgi:hypothetical protein
MAGLLVAEVIVEIRIIVKAMVKLTIFLQQLLDKLTSLWCGWKIS